MEDDVIALCRQYDGALGELYPEPAADQNECGRALFTGYPFPALIATRMYRPFDLHIVAMSYVPGRLEVP